MHINAINNNDLFKQAVLAIRNLGEESEAGNSQVNTDGTRYLDAVQFTVANPQDRWLNIGGRKSSAIAAIVETLWVLAGRNDLELLGKVLGRAHNFSDDGLTWRGAYGPRIYGNGQLQSVISRLRNNPNTRQAYLTIYDPTLDSDVGLAKTHPEGKAVTKDMICNLALLFGIKKGKLDITVINRSQDVLWGMSSINFIEFSILQEVLARVLNVDVGVYHLFSNNLHYYNNKVSRDQLETITGFTNVNVFSDPLEIEFNTNVVAHQNDIKAMFSSILNMAQNAANWNDMEEVLVYYGASTGLLADMAYVAWCRLQGVPIDLYMLRDLSLISTLTREESPDAKYLSSNQGV